MTHPLKRGASAALLAAALSTPAWAESLEVTHWWTSGGEAAAVAEFAAAFDATGNTWQDGAIAGSGGTARPIIVSRLLGGDPMAATQFNHGRQAEELIEAGLFRDLSEVATAEGWADSINPPSLLEACTVDGKVYCAPVNIHSAQWLWLSDKAFKDAGVEVPKDWNEFVAAAPALREAGKVPLALGGQPWQAMLLFETLVPTLGGTDLYNSIYEDKDVEVARSEEALAIWKAMADAREMSRGTNVQDWNAATNMVIQGEAGGQIMGDWAQGEFAVANMTAGEGYHCLPGLGLNEVISTGGDAFYFPVLGDEAKSAAQLELAKVLVSTEAQVAFNLKKGSLPVRGDVDLSATNACMQKGLEILASGNTIRSTPELITEDTGTQIGDLVTQFMNDESMTPEDAQARFADILSNAG